MKHAAQLPVFEDNFLEDNQELVPLFQQNRANSRMVAEFCSNFRGAAIASLLLTGQGDVFRRRLHRSGRAFCHFLSYIDAAQKRTSESEPLLDAMAAGDFATASTIASLSRRDQVADEEYEEDFLFFVFLITLSSASIDLTKADGFLAQWEHCLGDTEDPRLAVCQALLQSDAQAFDAAIPVLAKALTRTSSSSDNAPETRATEGQICIAGIALVRLARLRGLETRPEYLKVPMPALTTERIAWRDDSFLDCS